MPLMVSSLLMIVRIICIMAIGRFGNGNDVLENFKIDGKPLYKLVDELDEYEPM